MKAFTVISILLLSIAVSAALHYQKFAHAEDEIDMVNNSLKGARQFIKPNSRLRFSGEEERMELFAWARYLLAPAVLEEQANEDTTLSIKYLNTAKNDTTGQVLWETSDKLYRYKLTVR